MSGVQSDLRHFSLMLSIQINEYSPENGEAELSCRMYLDGVVPMRLDTLNECK